MRTRRSRWLVTTTLVVGTLALAAAAFGAPSSSPSSPQEALTEVQRSRYADVARSMVARAEAAKDRAASLRASGRSEDEARARVADDAAKTWAEAARDLTRAIEFETRAHESRRAATDAGAVAERERALLDEGMAQSGRLRAQLDALERVAAERPARTSAAAGTAARPVSTDAPSLPTRPPPSKVPSSATPNATTDAGAPARTDGGAR